MAAPNLEIKLDSTQIVELINSFNAKIESLEASLQIELELRVSLEDRVSEIETFLHI